MSITAEYVALTQFSVSDNHTAELRENQRVRLIQGVDGIAEGTISAVTYESGTNSTTVTLKQSVVTANLAVILLGGSYSEIGSSNLAPHIHTDDFSGGFLPAAGLTQTKIDGIQAFPAPQPGDLKKFPRVAVGETSYELYDLLGRTGGLIQSDGTGDPAFIAGTKGDIVYHDGRAWVSLGQSSNGKFLWLNAGVPKWMAPQLKNLDDVNAAVTDTAAVGDILVHNGTVYHRLAKGGQGNLLGINATGDVVWGDFLHVSASPDWTPPTFLFKDADKITIPAGRYFRGGYRFRGQYQNISGLEKTWDVSNGFDVDVGAVYSRGVTSGILGGKVNKSWYSIFMTAANELLLLPFLRVRTTQYDSSIATGKTIFHPGMHDDKTKTAVGFITETDQWNEYRLVRQSFGHSGGLVFTIEDTLFGGVQDWVVIDGDQRAHIADSNWFQLIPPADVDCVYLGVIRIDKEGNILPFDRTRTWRYAWRKQISVKGIQDPNPANTELAVGVPPTAESVDIRWFVSSQATRANAVDFNYYHGRDGTESLGGSHMSDGEETQWRALGVTYHIPLSAVTTLRNSAKQHRAGWRPIAYSELKLIGFRE